MSSNTALLVQGVTEDTPLWDEDDALDEAEKQAAVGKPTKSNAAAAKQVPAATGAVIPSAKKAKAKATAAKNSEEAAAVSPDQHCCTTSPIGLTIFPTEE